MKSRAILKLTILPTLLFLFAGLPGMAYSGSDTNIANMENMTDPVGNIIAAGGSDAAAAMRKQLFDFGWKFATGDYAGASEAVFDDSEWRTLNLPHDWSIEGITRPDAPSGNDGGYFPTGTGWYRKYFTIPADYRGKKVGMYFEGVYMNAEIFINGTSLGIWPYGYSPFFHDLTPYIKFGEENTIAVRVDNSMQKNCRWYTGSGIYRHVWLTVTDKVHVANWGTFVTTPEVSAGKATVQVATTLQNDSDTDRNVTLATSINNDGICQGTETTMVLLPAGTSREVKQIITVESPALWSPETPELYTANSTVSEDGRTLDTVSQTFGIRSITYSAEEGLRLNGKQIKLYGGCIHHDNGILGAAAYDRAEERKVEMLKEAGFNAVRTSHNIPSETFLDACDRLGLLVIDEAFDGWRDSKNTYDYSTLFDQWWKKDVSAMVLRDRNHPSIFCWSIGNEVIERKKLEVVTTARKLRDAILELDSTRPVTSALASWDSDWEIYDPLAAAHDIAGYNYRIFHARSDHERVPERMIIQTESFPRDAFTNWTMVNDNSYILGDFVWTAIDYLGESGIGRYYYDGEIEGEHYTQPQYPWHGAYCGDIDLTGWRKPISYYRQMLFNPSGRLHLAVREPDGYFGKINQTSWSVWPTWDSWTWPGHEGKPVEVEIYSRYPSVRLYLNGRLVGEQPTTREQKFMAVFTVPYEAGTIKAVGVENGQEKDAMEISTAGKPYRIRLTPDRSTISADGQDLSFITVEVTDKEGRVIPDAAERINFTIKGDGTIAAVGNANLQDTDSYTGSSRMTWKGRAIIVVRSTRESGTARLSASAPGLRSATVSIKTE